MQPQITRYTEYGGHPTRYRCLLESLKHIPEGDSCMEWPYGTDSSGRGVLRDPTTGISLRARTIAYRLMVGEISKGMRLVSTCNNDACYRPDHCFPGTARFVNRFRKRLKKIDFLIQAVIAHGDSANCLEWPFGRNYKDYGSVRYQGRMRGAHNVSHVLFVGPLANDEGACHTCDNPPCFNPKHLFAGTNVMNTIDCMTKGRKHLAKLTMSQAEEIRTLYANRPVRDNSGFINELAARFNVVRQTITSIGRGRLINHIPNTAEGGQPPHSEP